MTAPVWWIAAPSPWGPPGGDPVQADVEVPAPTRHPGLVRPIPADSEFKHCDTRPHWTQQSTCRSWCKLIYEGYPVAPDGRSFAARGPAGQVLLIPMHCLHPYQSSEGTPRTVEVTAEDAPAWAKPVDLLNPPPSFSLSLPPTPGAPGPTQAEELRRASAAVPPPSLPDLGSLAAAIPPGVVKAIGDAVTGGRVDLAGIVAVLVQGLGLGERIRQVLGGIGDKVASDVGKPLEQLPPELAQLRAELTAGLVPGVSNLGLAFLQAAGHTAGVQLEGAAAEGEATRETVGGLPGKLFDAAGDALEPLLKRAVAALSKAFEFVGDKMEDLGALMESQIGAVYRDSLEARAPVTAENVKDVAALTLRNALAAGLAAQTTALLLELLHPVKRLGLNQVVGFIADFAGFGQVAGAYTGPSLRHGLQVPAEHRAAAVFRTAVPGAGEAAEQAFQRHISLGDYAHLLALQGFPSWWIKVLVDDVFVDPRPRELSQLLEDSEADPVWLAAKLREVGWDDSDVEKGTTALLLRSTQPGRSRVIAAAMREYAKGHITGAELDRHLSAAALREEHRALWHRAARLERRGDLMEDVAGRVLRQYREDVTTAESARQQLEGLGFIPEEVQTRLLEAELDRQVKQLREEDQATEAHVRQIRSASLANLKVQLRAGQLDRRGFLAWGEVLGFTRGYLENVAELELLKGPPAKAEELPVFGLGAVQEAAAQMARLLADETRQGRVTALAAVEILAQLGVGKETARDLLRVAEVLGLPSPGPLGLPVPDGRGGRLGLEAQLAEVLGGIRRGLGGRTLLREISGLLGIPAPHTASRDPVLRILEELGLER